jgi:hypothetical protein
MAITDDREIAGTYSSTGKFAVLSMIAVALLAASFAWWWNFNRGRQAMELYGPEAATLIRTAPKVELLTGGGVIEISKAPGLLNARASLLSDASYRWHESANGGHPDAAVRFSDGQRFVVVEFDFDAEMATASSTGKSAKLMKKTADGWRQFIERNVAAHTKATKPPAPAHTAPSE